jgi:Zn-dependent peptidase ImmA (M78 family)
MVYDNTFVPVYFTDIKRYELIHVKGGTIILDESLLRRGSEGRLRFTCAHELAHWLRHKEIYSGTGQAAALVNPKISSEDNPVLERQANQLATALLMPTGQVKKAFYAVRNIPDPTASLAKLFGVSKQAMGIFLSEHNLR